MRSRNRLTLYEPATYQIVVPGEPDPSWSDWFRTRQVARNPVLANGQQVSMSSVGLEFASAGLGVVLGQRQLAEPWLRDGRLLALSPDSLPLGQGYFAIHAHSRHEPALLDALLRALGAATEPGPA